jgi:hypothetical protein
MQLIKNGNPLIGICSGAMNSIRPYIHTVSGAPYNLNSTIVQRRSHPAILFMEALSVFTNLYYYLAPLHPLHRVLLIRLSVAHGVHVCQLAIDVFTTVGGVHNI